MGSDREVHAFQQSSHTIGEPERRCQSRASGHFTASINSDNDLGFEQQRRLRVRTSQAHRSAACRLLDSAHSVVPIKRGKA